MLVVMLAAVVVLLASGTLSPEFAGYELGFPGSRVDLALSAALFLLMGLSSVWLIARASGVRTVRVIQAAVAVARSDRLLILWVFALTFVAGTVLDRLLVPVGLDSAELSREILARPWFAFLAVTIGPAAEELWGRGLLYGTLRRWGVWSAVLGSSLVSAAVHLNWVQFIGTLPAMLGLGWLRHKTGRVGPGIVLHMGWNMLALILGWLLTRL